MSATPAPRGGGSAARDTVQSIGRAIDLLRLIATRGRRGARISDLVTWSGIPAPTAHRLLKSLQAEGLVTHAASREYLIGPLAYELGLAASIRPNFADVCLPVLEELARRTGFATHLLVPSGLEIVCIQRAVPTQVNPRMAGSVRARRRAGDDVPGQRWVGGVGVRRPIGVLAGGQAVLAETSDAVVDRILAGNAEAYRRFFMEPAAVRAAVERARRAGFAATTSGTPRFVHVGVAVRDRQNNVVAALKVLRPPSEAVPAGTDRLVAVLHGAACEMRALLA